MLRLLNVDPGVGLSDAEVVEVGSLSVLMINIAAILAARLLLPEHRHAQSMEAMNSHLKKVTGGLSSFAQMLTGHTSMPFVVGTPFWKLVLKQFDDLLVKVGSYDSTMPVIE